MNIVYFILGSFVILFTFFNKSLTLKSALKPYLYAFSCEYALIMFTIPSYNMPPSHIGLVFSFIVLLFCLLYCAKKLLKDNGVLANIVGILFLLETIALIFTVIINIDPLKIENIIVSNIIVILVLVPTTTLIELINPNYRLLCFISTLLIFLAGNAALIIKLMTIIDSNNMLTDFYSAITYIQSLPANLDDHNIPLVLISVIIILIYNSMMLTVLKNRLINWWKFSRFRNLILK